MIMITKDRIPGKGTLNFRYPSGWGRQGNDKNADILAFEETGVKGMGITERAVAAVPEEMAKLMVAEDPDKCSIISETRANELIAKFRKGAPVVVSDPTAVVSALTNADGSLNAECMSNPTKRAILDPNDATAGITKKRPRDIRDSTQPGWRKRAAANSE